MIVHTVARCARGREVQRDRHVQGPAVRIELWLDHGIGLVEPSGELGEQQLPALRKALFIAMRHSRCLTVLIVEDEISYVCPAARRVICFYARTCRARGGELAVVSTDGKLRASGRISELGVIHPAFSSLDVALDELSGVVRR
jgi:anti-anti-sigma factor